MMLKPIATSARAVHIEMPWRMLGLFSQEASGWENSACSLGWSCVLETSLLTSSFPSGEAVLSNKGHGEQLPRARRILRRQLPYGTFFIGCFLKLSFPVVFEDYALSFTCAGEATAGLRGRLC